MHVVVAGDWHGDSKFAENTIEEIKGLNLGPNFLFFHCGDFGVWPGVEGKKYLDRINLALSGSLEEALHVTLGNHEDWAQCQPILKEAGNNRVAQLYGYIFLTPKVGVVNYGPITVAHIAGATSVDRAVRTEGIDWWADEELTEEDEELSNKIGQQKVDLIICHDAPYSVPVPLSDDSYLPKLWQPFIPQAREHRKRLERIINNLVSPESTPILVHGHYHVRYETSDTPLGYEGIILKKVIGLSDNGNGYKNNFVTLDF